MVDVNARVKVQSWPSPQDYNEAIQNLAANTTDAQLRSGRVHVTGLGLPRPLTGAFASVYRVDCTHMNAVAVRCFLRDLRDQEARYEQISNFVQQDDLPYTVTFDFLRQGIRVGANWFPALKMDWVNGPNLDQYIERHLDSQHTLARLARDFHQMCIDLRQAGIAHGDLQHGNIIVADEGLRLVDYDGMFVPAMKGAHSHELGHRNYQHPARAAKHFNASLDNFSAWAIYTSICCTALDPSLWDVLLAGDDCLLFRRDDFAQPEHSFAFNVLEHHENEVIRKFGKFMRWLCHQSIEDVPPLEAAPLTVPATLPALAGPVMNVAEEQRRRRPGNIVGPKAAAATAANASVATAANAAAATAANATAATAAKASAATTTPVQYNAIMPGVEPELNQPAPRWVARTGDAFSITHSSSEDLVARGTPARTIQFRMDRYHDQQTEVLYFRAKYKFAVNGRVIDGEARLSESQAIGLAKAKQVTILYDPGRPAMNAIYACLPFRAVGVVIPPDVEPELIRRERSSSVSDNPPYNYYVPMLVTALLGLAALGIAAYCAGQLHPLLVAVALTSPFVTLAHMNGVHRGLIERGIPARARVIDVHHYQNGVVRIKYRFKSYESSLQQSVTTNDTEMKDIKVGDKITILYDINRPESHVVYKLSSFKVD